MRLTILMLAACSVLLGAMVRPVPAAGQPADMEALYQEAARLRERHQDAAALVLYQRAWDATRQAALAQIGLAEGALGRWLEAEEHVQQALATPGDPWIERTRATLESALRTIHEHVGRLEVLSPVPGAELWIQGQRVSRLPMTSPVRMIAGPVSFEIRAPGHAPMTRSTTILGGGLARETVDLADLESGAARSGSTQRTLGWIALAGAGVGLVLGGVGTGLRYVEVEDYNASPCPGGGAPTQPGDCGDRLGRVDAMQVLAIAGFVAGGALGVTSVLLLLTAPSGRRAPATALLCGAGPGDLGVACRMRF